MDKELLEVIKRLMSIWKDSFINNNFELILETRRNIYIGIDMFKTKKDIYINMLEWKSRPCIKGDNEEVLKNFRDKFNKFFNRNFTKEELEIIYQRLGNGVNRELAIKFYDSGYDMKILKNKE